MQEQLLNPQQALLKIKQYCAYQERCHTEVKEKLYGYGLYKNDVEEMMSKLIEENYLNEERFAMHFAGGKFRIKKWGKIKIKYQLRQKKITAYCINKALACIDETAYFKTLHHHAEQKLKSLKGEKNIFIKKKKLQDHLRMKGYEAGLITNVVNEITK